MVDWTSHRFASCVLQAALSMLLLACCWTVALGGDRSVQSEDSGINDVSEDQADPKDQAKKERVVTAAVLLLVLVIGVSAGLLVVIVLWGGRVRRAARKPTARIVPGDELWFLKPKKSEIATRPAATPQEDDPSVSDTDAPDGQ